MKCFDSQALRCAPRSTIQMPRLLWAFGLLTALGLAGCGSDGGVDPDPDLGVADDLGTTPDEGVLVDTGVCVDGDEDGHGVDCAQGADCDDTDASNWTGCATCVDDDGDGAFTGCDAYVDITGPDCDDADAVISPEAYELADDGIDNDCDGSDLVAATASAGIFVAGVAGCSDVSPTRGSRQQPACTLNGALGRATHGDYFVESSTQDIASAAFSGGNVRLYGGYDPSDWSRNASDDPTSINVDSVSAGDPMITFVSGGSFLVDGFVINATPVGDGVPERAAFELTPTERADFRRVRIATTGLIGAIAVSGINDDRPSMSIIEARVSCSDTSLLTSSLLECVRGSALEHAQLAFSSFRTNSVGRNLHVVELQDVRHIDILNNAFQASSMDSSSRIVVANSPLVFNAIANSIAIRSASNSYAGVFELGEVGSIVLVNNATQGWSAATVWLFENSDTLGALTARNNHFYETGTPAMAAFATRFNRSTVTTYTSTGAAEFNACSMQCQDVGGNFAGDPLFTGPEQADFLVSGASPLVDAGVDPGPYVRIPGVGFSFSGTRPQGGLFDVGAYELEF